MRAVLALAFVALAGTLGWRLAMRSALCEGSRRSALIVAAVVGASAAIVLTETASVVDGVRPAVLYPAWGLAIVALGAATGRPRRRPLPGVPGDAPDRMLVAGAAFVLASIGLVALLAPPNTADVLSYHLPRVMHWVQDGSVRDYPAHVLQQLKATPGAEELVLQLVVLAGDDRLVNLVQWVSLCLVAVAASLVARELEGTGRAQVVAAALAVAVPSAIAEASGAKNDVVASLWLVSMALLVLQFRRSPSTAGALVFGLATGLALLTKETAYLYAAPFVLWFALLALRGGRRPALSRMALVGAAVVLLNGPFWTRNLVTFGSPFGPAAERTTQGTFPYANDLFTPSALASGLIRNAALELAPPWKGGVDAIETSVARLHQVIGIDENDTRTTWPGQTFALPRGDGQRFEDHVPNVLPFLLALLSAIIVLVRYRRGPLSAYVLCVAAGAILFSVVFRWQPWHGRLHIPLFELSAPFVAVALVRSVGARATAAVAVLALLAALPWVLDGRPRALLGAHSVFAHSRTEQLFTTGARERPLRRVARRVAAHGCGRVGLVTDAEAFEYPLWPLLRHDLGRRPDIRDVNVRNASRRYRLPRRWRPCAVIWLAPNAPTPPPARLTVEKAPFAAAWHDEGVTLLLPAAHERAARGAGT